jgi:hypothetical protein
MRHYLMTTDDHFQAAVQGNGTTTATAFPKAQKAAQQSHAVARSAPQSVPAAHEKPPALPGLAGSCEIVLLPKVAGAGLEPATHGL